MPPCLQPRRSSVAMRARALVLVLDGGKASDERDASSLAGDAPARDAFDQLGGEIGDRVHGGSRKL